MRIALSALYREALQIKSLRAEALKLRDATKTCVAQVLVEGFVVVPSRRGRLVQQDTFAANHINPKCIVSKMEINIELGKKQRAHCIE